MLELGLEGRHAFVAGVGGGIGSACVRAASYITGQTLVVDGGATGQFPLSRRA